MTDKEKEDILKKEKMEKEQKEKDDIMKNVKLMSNKEVYF